MNIAPGLICRSPAPKMNPQNGKLPAVEKCHCSMIISRKLMRSHFIIIIDCPKITVPRGNKTSMTPPKDLLQVVTGSERRKEILLLLHESTRTREEIKELIGINAQQMNERIKELKEASLVNETEGTYQLTALGNVVVEHFKPFLDTLTAIEANEEFWIDHDISAIPYEFLSRIAELKECKVVSSEPFRICESSPEFREQVANAVYFKGVACVFIPCWIRLFLKLSSYEVPIEIIVSKGIYELIKREYPNELETYLKNENAHMYICEDIATSFAVTDAFFSLSLNSISPTGKTGNHDTKDDLQSVDPASIKWGNDLFEYYKIESVEIDRPGHLEDTAIPKPLQQPLST